MISLTPFETTCFYALLLGTLSFVTGAFGYSISQTNEDLMTYLNAVSTGVILAAAFTHLLPDAIRDLSSYSYPVATACSLAGFLLLVTVETIMQQLNFESDHTAAVEEHKMHDCADHNYEEGAAAVHPELGVLQSSAISQLKRAQSIKNDSKRKGLSDSVCSVTEPIVHKYCDHNSGMEHDHEMRHNYEDTNRECGGHHDHDHGHNSYQNDHAHINEHSPLVKSAHVVTHKGHSHGHSHGHHREMNQNGDQQHTSFSSAITFWGALMVHSTLEGFGIGVTSSVQQAAIVFAITIHKGFESLALVGALADSKISFTLYCFLYGIFCCSVPAGAILGALLKSSSANSHFAGIITGLASGSFMYIGTMEMLPHTLSSCKNMSVGMLLFIGSAIAMAALAGVV